MEDKVRLGIVVSEFNYDVTYLMLQRAMTHAEFLGAEIKIIFKSPGSYDASAAVNHLLRRKDIDGVVVLGAVIQGETKHDEVIAHQVARKLMDLSIEYGKPVGLGIIGPGASRSQAQERIDEYARRAVESTVKMVRRLSKLRESEEVEGVMVVE